MDTATRERVLGVLTMIVEDAETDARKLDGQPFNGSTVATNLGQMYASIQALAKIVKTDIESRSP
jgi:hypothetical protein